MTERRGGYRFRRHERLKRRNEITRVFKQGRSVTCFGAKLFYLGNCLDHNRIVWTFAKKFGNAVERNRARRLGREAYRFLGGGMKKGYDLVLLMYPEGKGGQKRRLSSGVPVPENPPVVRGGSLEKPRQPALSGKLRQLKTLIARAGLV